MLILLSTTSVIASEAELKKEIEKLRSKNENIENQMNQLQMQTKSLIESKIELNKTSQKSSETDTKVCGYTELIYNAYSNEASRSQMDLRRFVLFIGKNFNEKLSFNSEVEWEHSVVSANDSGETAVEQAYINYQFSPNLSMKAGLFLMPFGFINESHEPPTFYGAERNEIETRIIPTTWREGGLSLTGSTDSNIDWGLGLVTAFDLAKFSDAAKPLRALRQKLQVAKAQDLAVYGTLNYRLPGFVVGTALYSGQSGQGNADYNANTTLPNFAGIAGRVSLADVHMRLQENSWDVQALLAKGMVADAEQINQVLKDYNTANATSLPYVASEFYGWLTQVAYAFNLTGDESLAPFIRYEQFNSQSKMPTGYSASAKNADDVVTAGVSYKPHAQVVFKTDYQNYRDNSTRNRFNLAMGYMF